MMQMKDRDLYSKTALRGKAVEVESVTQIDQISLTTGASKSNLALDVLESQTIFDDQSAFGEINSVRGDSKINLHQDLEEFKFEQRDESRDAELLEKLKQKQFAQRQEYTAGEKVYNKCLATINICNEVDKMIENYIRVNEGELQEMKDSMVHNMETKGVYYPVCFDTPRKSSNNKSKKLGSLATYSSIYQHSSASNKCSARADYD